MNNSTIQVGRSMLVAIAGALFFVVPARAQDAAGLYKAKCSACHGADGKGDTPVGKKLGVVDFAAPQVQKESDEELAGIIAKGKNKMPAFGTTLKDSQIKDLVAYIRGLGKK